jgi:hypothetical protein
MARLERILESNEKKLNISRFLPDECKEKDAEGNLKDDDYITIKKIPHDIKSKIRILSLKSFGGEASKAMLKKIKEKGYSIKDIENIEAENIEEVTEFMLDIDYSSMETDEMSRSTLLIEQYILDYGVDKEKHSFRDFNDKPIDLNYETLNIIGNEFLIKYIVDNIKSFSKGFVLEK